MMMMKNAGSDVDVILRETIKPSSPTPHTHKTFKLSLLDQLFPTFYVPVIFFYVPKPDHDNHLTITQTLKTSFSEALSVYYPLAGQLDPENLSVVDCNDAGAQFVQARAHGRMDDVTRDPQMDQLLKYLPFDPARTFVPSGPLLAVQVSRFDCGGIAVGVCSFHRLTDAVSLISFVASWAGKCRQGQNGKLTPPPVFDLARHFPPRDEFLGSDGLPRVEEKREKVRRTTKRYVFDTERLGALRRAVASADGSAVRDPTRVELVTAFIWRCVIEAAGGESKHEVSAAWHVVNLRPRIKSRAMENVFGNCVLDRFVLSEGEEEAHELVSGLRNGLREVDEEYIWKAAGGCLKENKDLISKDDHAEGCLKKEMESCCGFSSWSRLPVYEMDFGLTMGKPVWVCPATMCPDLNFGFLMGTKDGVGIELWLNMLESTLPLVDIKFQLLASKSQV